MLAPLGQNGAKRTMLGQDDWRKIIKDWLIEAFAASGLTQARLGELIGVSQTQIGKYLFGPDMPGDEKLPLLGRALGRAPPRMLIMPGVAEAEVAFQDQAEQLLTIWRRLGPQQRSALIAHAERLVTS